jgi:hypothetical protein
MLSTHCEALFQIARARAPNAKTGWRIVGRGSRASDPLGGVLLAGPGTRPSFLARTPPLGPG